MSSLQLQQYLQLRADGETIERACELSTIGAAEAALHEADIASGELALPEPSRAQVHVHAREEARYETEGKLMARDCETTISVNGGPEHTLDEVREALDIVKSRAGGPTVAAAELRLFIERIERLKEEVKALNEDVASVYSEAHAQGYDKATMRRIVRLRGMDSEARMEAAALLETYADALGLQGALPL
jgi:uncharacterized protein (UPF0335 family)